VIPKCRNRGEIALKMKSQARPADSFESSASVDGGIFYHGGAVLFQCCP
jgi:hypothetical protein